MVENPKELLHKAWVLSGYSMIQNLEDESASKELVQYPDQELGSIVENIAGADGMTSWIDDANDPYPEFPEEEDGDPSWRESESEVSSFGSGDDKDDNSSDGMSIIDEDKDFN